MPDNASFTIGVCVTLKSGSPKMTVCGMSSKHTWHISGEDYPSVSAVWFDGGECRTAGIS